MPPHVRTVRGPLDPTTAAAVRTLAHAAHEHDGVEALGEQTLLDLTADEDAHLHLLLGRDEGGGTADDGALVGYAALDLTGDPASAELVVAPSRRLAGLGRALLEEVHAAAARSGRAAPAVWAHGDLDAARALATAAGLTVHRELWRMGRDLRADEPEPEVPAGTTVRSFVPGRDEEAVVATNAAAFAWHPEQGRMTVADVRARAAEPWFDPADLLLLERDGALLGFLWLKVERTSDGRAADDGELYVLAVDPGTQGQGLGRYLAHLAPPRLAARGARRIVLYTEATNTAAVGLYRAMGLVTERSDVQYRRSPADDTMQP
ncbi:mycothiol synthase [Cellulomonas sp. APG4]|uniref:mycothiol synthase n=1 Tax=Cellulomonas sp. APG4 TaxID=1538656 RepID=UPI00192A205A|nr:mycothiol synthase [Cellulomonas sp. APG4]